MSDRPRNQGLRIGLVGHGFMGRVHALAWRTAQQVYPLPADPVLAGLAGRDPERARHLGRQAKHAPVRAA
jgi:predicted dehydrogenase